MTNQLSVEKENIYRICKNMRNILEINGFYKNNPCLKMSLFQKLEKQMILKRIIIIHYSWNWIEKFLYERVCKDVLLYYKDGCKTVSHCGETRTSTGHRYSCMRRFVGTVSYAVVFECFMTLYELITASEARRHSSLALYYIITSSCHADNMSMETLWRVTKR